MYYNLQVAFIRGVNGMIAKILLLLYLCTGCPKRVLVDFSGCGLIPPSRTGGILVGYRLSYFSSSPLSTSPRYAAIFY